MGQAIESKVSGSARQALYELQVEQHHHDEVYHREIARLSLHQRLNHMALHFAKYAGKVAASRTVDQSLSVQVDVLIIALSTANVLNLNLWDALDHRGHEYPGLLAFGRALAHGESISEDQFSVIREMIIAAGRVAAACEKIDHLEAISFRSEIEQGVSRLTTIALAILASHNIEPVKAINERLAGVKTRLKLHGRI